MAFSTFDRDGDGVITSRELRQVLVHLGFDADSREVDHMIRKVDLDGKKMRACAAPATAGVTVLASVCHCTVIVCSLLR